MRALDLFCGAGGASEGYLASGVFDSVVGVDITHQKRYRGQFIQADAMTFGLDGYDFIHASPPCQAYSRAQRIMDNDHPDYIAELRLRLQASGVPYVIENVVGSPLKDPIELCGAMFGLKVYRHRLFECSFPASPPKHPEHIEPLTKMGRKVINGCTSSATSLACSEPGILWASRG